MPLYDFECTRCGKLTERLVRASEADAQLACEGCGAELKRLLSAPAVLGGCDAGGSGFT